MTYYANKSGYIAITPSKTLFKNDGDEVIIPDDAHAQTLLKGKAIRKTKKGKATKADKEKIDNKMDNPSENKSDDKKDNPNEKKDEKADDKKPEKSDDDKKDKSLLEKAADKAKDIIGN